MKQTYETGLTGEMIAENYLTGQKGMTCLERRYRNKGGEIDLILMDQETIVFAEVKTRFTAAPGQGLLAVNTAKQRRIIRAATLYLMTRRQLNAPVRFDVLEVRHDSVLHIPNAFQADGRMFFR